MLLISTYVAPSSIEGIGVFAAEPVARGGLMWSLNPKFDVFVRPDEIEGLPAHMQDFIARYSYDEFAFILPETDGAGIEAVARRIQERITAFNLELAQLEPRGTLESVFGGASFPQDAPSKEILISRANDNLLKSRG